MLMSKEPKSTNISWQPSGVSREDREELQGRRSALLWFTGLSGSGKTTLSRATERILRERGAATYVLDGDNIRFGLCRDLGFSPEDRTENIRRIGEVAKLFVDAGVIVMAAFISPYRQDRDQVRSIQVRSEDFIEVFLDCPLEECERRDPKGLYLRARSGEIANFTGISAPYEAPSDAELIIRTADENVEESAQRIVQYLIDGGILKS